MILGLTGRSRPAVAAAVSPDGERFLIVQWVQPVSAAAGLIGPDTFSGLTVALHWTQNLKQ
jgi:hypothetical protein